MATEMEIDSPQPKELFEAAEKGDASLFKSLADQQLNKARALRNDDGRSLLHVAAASGRSEVIRVLSDADPSVSGVNSKDEEGWAPIHSAASCGHHEIVEILIEKGADVNLANDGGRTALHYAASKGQVKISETLISHGAKINQKDKVGCTPLHRAASTGNRELCELLIEEGAEVDVTDRAGQTPLMNAVICANKEGGADFIVLKYLDVDGIRIIGSVVGQSIALDHYIRQVDDMVEEDGDFHHAKEEVIPTRGEGEIPILLM